MSTRIRDLNRFQCNGTRICLHLAVSVTLFFGKHKFSSRHVDLEEHSVHCITLLYNRKSHNSNWIKSKSVLTMKINYTGRCVLFLCCCVKFLLYIYFLFFFLVLSGCFLSVRILSSEFFFFILACDATRFDGAIKSLICAANTLHLKAEYGVRSFIDTVLRYRSLLRIVFRWLQLGRR